MISYNSIQKENILTLQEIKDEANLDDKIASAGAVKELYGSFDVTNNALNELKNIVMRFEYIGSGVHSGENERNPYFDFSNCSEGLYFVKNTSNNAGCYGAVTWVTKNDGYLTFSQSTRSEGYTIFSASGFILYGSSLSWYANMLVWKVTI